jgi:glycosyltransferase involved in cell wall biosynthesis
VYKKGKVPKEVTKYCFKANNPNEAARIITELQKNGYPMAKRNQATRYARSFSWDACAKNTLEIYSNMLKW